MLLFINKVSKANAAFTNVPSSIRIPQENITENPKFCIEISIVPMSPRRLLEANLPPVSAASEAAPATQVLEPWDTAPRLNDSGEISTSFPPTETEMGVSKSQGTVIEKYCEASDRQHY
jgi:hypothetical protein